MPTRASPGQTPARSGPTGPGYLTASCGAAWAVRPRPSPASAHPAVATAGDRAMEYPDTRPRASGAMGYPFAALRGFASAALKRALLLQPCRAVATCLGPGLNGSGRRRPRLVRHGGGPGGEGLGGREPAVEHHVVHPPHQPARAARGEAARAGSRSFDARGLRAEPAHPTRGGPSGA